MCSVCSYQTTSRKWLLFCKSTVRCSPPSFILLLINSIFLLRKNRIFLTLLSTHCCNTTLIPPNQRFDPEGRTIPPRSLRCETLICVVKVNTSWEDYSHVWTASFKLCMPPVERRMVGMEGHWCLHDCQLADKGWPCLISLPHHGNFGWWRYSLFCHLLSHCLTSQQSEGIWPRARVCTHVNMCACAQSCIICEGLNACAHRPALLSTELSINTLLPFSAHTYSVLLTVCCHMLYCCVCCVCCRVEGLS